MVVAETLCKPCDVIAEVFLTAQAYAELASLPDLNLYRTNLGKGNMRENENTDFSR